MEECDEWELLLSPPRKRQHKQAAIDDKAKKREALEIDIGTGIIVQGGTTTRRPLNFPQNPPFNPTRPDTTTQRPINFPNERPQVTPFPPANRPSQPPPTIYHEPFFPNNLFPSPGSRPFSPDGDFPTPATPRPPVRPTFPSGSFPGSTTPNNFFPGISTPRPGFPITPNLGPDYIPPTTHRPPFPGFPFSGTTRKPCSCRNHTDSAAPPPPVLFTPIPIGPPVTPASPQFPNLTPGVLRPTPVTPTSQFPSLTPGVLRPIPVGPPVTSRPQFPSPSIVGSPVTPRPQFPSLIPGVRRPPSPLGPPATPRPQFPGTIPLVPRPPSTLAPPASSRPLFPGGFRTNVTPKYTPVATFPIFPNTQPRPVIILPYYNPQVVSGLNRRPASTNLLLPRFPSRQPSFRQGLPAPSPVRVYHINQPRHQAPKKEIQLKKTTKK